MVGGVWGGFDCLVREIIDWGLDVMHGVLCRTLARASTQRPRACAKSFRRTPEINFSQHAHAIQNVVLWRCNWTFNQSSNTMLFRPQRHMTFLNFEKRPGSIEARSVCAGFANCCGKSFWDPILILAGRPGAGKTHLLHATANLVKKNLSIQSSTTISSRRLAEEVQRCKEFDDLHVRRDRFGSEDFLAVDDVDDLFGHAYAEDFLLEVLRMREDQNLRTLLSASLTTALNISCPLNTFLDSQSAVRLL